MRATLALTLLGFGAPYYCAPRAPPKMNSHRHATNKVVMSNIFEDVADGNFVAILEAAAFGAAGLVGGSAAWSLVQRDASDDSGPPSPPPPRASDQVAVEVDLGEGGEPKGISRLLFKPLLPRSEFLQVELRVPLGCLIEERENRGGTIAVTGALPGYSAFGVVEEGDLVRALTAYAMVAGDAPMWQQVTSGTPLGDVTLKKLVFKTEGATYADVRDAIASHRTDDGGDGMVTLVLERAVNASTPAAPRARASLESLPDVLKKDLKTPAGKEAGSAGNPTAGERARRLLEWRPTAAPRAPRSAASASAAAAALVLAAPPARAAAAAESLRRFAFVGPLDEAGRLSATNLGKDVLLTDLYGLPAAFAYLAWRYSQEGTLQNAWPPSPVATALWAACVVLVAVALPRLVLI